MFYKCNNKLCPLSNYVLHNPPDSSCVICKCELCWFCSACHCFLKTTKVEHKQNTCKSGWTLNHDKEKILFGYVLEGKARAGLMKKDKVNECRLISVKKTPIPENMNNINIVSQDLIDPPSEDGEFVEHYNDYLDKLFLLLAGYKLSAPETKFDDYFFQEEYIKSLVSEQEKFLTIQKSTKKYLEPVGTVDSNHQVVYSTGPKYLFDVDYKNAVKAVAYRNGFSVDDFFAGTEFYYGTEVGSTHFSKKSLEVCTIRFVRCVNDNTYYYFILVQNSKLSLGLNYYITSNNVIRTHQRHLLDFCKSESFIHLFNHPIFLNLHKQEPLCK